MALQKTLELRTCPLPGLFWRELSLCCAHIMQSGLPALWSWPTLGDLGKWKWPTSSGISSTYCTYADAKPCRDGQRDSTRLDLTRLRSIVVSQSVIGEVPWSSRPLRLTTSARSEWVSSFYFFLHNFSFGLQSPHGVLASVSSLPGPGRAKPMLHGRFLHPYVICSIPMAEYIGLCAWINLSSICAAC